MTRRTFVAAAGAATVRRRGQVRSEVFLRSPGRGTAVMAQAYYTPRSGGAMMSIEHRFSRSDTLAAARAALTGTRVDVATVGSLRDRSPNPHDLGGAVEESIKRVAEKIQLLRGYHIDWEGEYESEKRAEARLLIIVPLTVLLIFIILYTRFRSFKWAI